jgi:hypothetical protein
MRDARAFETTPINLKKLSFSMSLKASSCSFLDGTTRVNNGGVICFP